MADYFVDGLNGSDANSGTTTVLAWKSLGKAFAASGGISSGDSLYIRPFTYNTSFTIALANPTSTTNIIGDITGEKFGVTGDVVWSGILTSDTVAGLTPLNLGNRPFFNFKNITFITAGNVTAVVMGTATSTIFDKCIIHSSGGTGITLTIGANSRSNNIFNSCIVNAKTNGINVTRTNSTTSQWDMDITVQNCFFIGRAFIFSNSGAGTFFASGGKFLNNTFFTPNDTILELPPTAGGAFTSLFYNNLFIQASQAFRPTTATTVISCAGNFNKFAGCGNTNSLYSSGANDIGYNTLFGNASINLGQSLLYQTQNSAFGLPYFTDLVVGRGTSSIPGITLPTTDILGNLRPNPPSIGAFEPGTAYRFPSSSGFVGGVRGWASLRTTLPT